MALNANLSKAKAVKNDEFYTQLTDVANELRHYKAHFKDKVVYCNCDNPEWSNFWNYFHLNFAELGLKKLIATFYDAQKPVYKKEYMGGDDTNLKQGTITYLEGNGDFRNAECVTILEESDIVATNPPFSLFREYIDLLLRLDKSFIVIGNKNATHYKEIFAGIQANKLWVGMKPMGGSLWFTTPEGFQNKSDKVVNGVKLSESPCCWYTNLDIPKRHNKLILWKAYDPAVNLPYSNCEGINVDKTEEIPKDYAGIMGVPISFLDKYNAEQFEITGLISTPKIGNKRLFVRVLIRNRHPEAINTD